MAVNITLDTDLDKELDKVNKLIDKLDLLNDKANIIQFVSIKDFCKLTGWSEKTVQELYNRPDFPSCDYGKEKKAEVHAILKYFEVPRRR